MSLSLVLFLICGTLASQAMSRRTLYEVSVANKHEKWMSRHGRVYEDESEKERRFNIFKDNLEYIRKFNKAANKTFKLGVNEFADMTHDEFLASRNGYMMNNNNNNSRLRTTIKTESFRFQNLTDFPTSWDWRELGAVTPVKKQGTCGCCWAFSAVAALEGITKIRTGNLIPMSVQQLLDCTYTNNGCRGGFMTNAFYYIWQNEGLTTEENYSYQEMQGYCSTEKARSEVATRINNYAIVPQNEEALLQAVLNQPVSVAIDSTNRNFQHYSSGIYNEYCGTNLIHAVTVVGYGTSYDGTKYWLLKNSWGQFWGENGYMRILRDVGYPQGLCGITLEASFPMI